jgi:hypothetical protein
MTWAAGSNSFSPDHRPGFAAGAVPPSPPPPASRTNGSLRVDVLVDYVTYFESDTFDWLAIVLLPGDTESRRRIFVIPRALADAKAKRDKPTAKTANERYWRIDEVPNMFAAFDGNLSLTTTRTIT